MDDEKLWGSSFFERLDTGAAKVARRDYNVDELLGSVKRNLVKVLNSRVGESQSCPDYGLVDFNDASMGSAALVMRIKFAIIECIKRFEPRVSDVQVVADYDPDISLSLRFNIAARLTVASREDVVRIDLLLDSNRRYRVL